MGVKTLAQFQNTLALALGRTIDPTLTLDWINNALFEFGYAFKFPELQAKTTLVTIQGTDAYNLPADFRAFDETGVLATTPQNRVGGILAKESRSNYLRAFRFVAANSQGPARSYHRYQNQIVFRPIPDSTVTTFQYDYWKRITPLAAPGDVSVFQDDWDDVIFRGALYRGHMNYGEHDRMMNIFQMFLGLIRSRVMQEDLEEFPEGGISAIQSQYDSIRR